jgi:3(or 17)beta-hydroxysteroid dehydrogenase
MGDLAGKTAIVTGAASGIGAATVKRLRQEGANVIGTDIQEELGRQVTEAEGAMFALQDVADAVRWAEVVDLARENYGRLDVLVNNAGITTGASIEDVDVETWDRVIAINLTGVMHGCQQAIRVMRENPAGISAAIINIASTTAYTALPTDVGYTAAKSGVRMMTKSIAVHCAQQGLAIRCNTIIPGATETAIIAKAAAEIPELRDTIAATSPLNRLAQPEEIAAGIAFLAQDGCPFMIGAELMIDGGALAIHPGF